MASKTKSLLKTENSKNGFDDRNMFLPLLWLNMRIKYLWSCLLFNVQSNPFQVKFSGVWLLWFTSAHYEYNNKNSDKENMFLSRCPHYSVWKYAELFWDQNFIVQIWRLVVKPSCKQFQERTLPIALRGAMLWFLDTVWYGFEALSMP